MPKDYYLILGITSDATLDDIKDAYRRLVKEFHPDYYGENHSPFLAIQEAYSVLSDPAKRHTHDLAVHRQKKRETVRSGESIRPGRRGHVEPLIPEQEAFVDLERASLARPFHWYRSSFEDLFDRIFGNFRQTSRPKSEHPDNLNVVITLTPEQAFQGGQVNIVLPAELACPACNGQGRVGPYQCVRCHGKGILSGEYPMMVSYPSGISDNHTLRIPLDTYGVEDSCLTVHFRINETF